MKKTALLLVILLASMVASRAQRFSAISPSGDMLTYEIVNNYAIVTGRSDSVTSADPYIDLVIPTYVSHNGQTFPVRVIGEEAFMNDYRLHSVQIPPSVKAILPLAFSSCHSIGTIQVPSTVDSIGNMAFFSVSNITYDGGAVGMPWGARYYNAYVQDGWCYSDESMSHLVYADKQTTHFSYPATVRTIDMYAYAGTMIDSLWLDGTDTILAADLQFSDCLNLKYVYYNFPGNYHHNCFLQNCLSLESITFGENVKAIPDYFCKGCKSLKKVVIPDNVKEIKTSFERCSKLESVHIGDSVSIVFMWAFRYCTMLRDVYFGKSVTTIETGSFTDCDSLRQVMLPESVTNISDAFAHCPNLESIVCMSKTPPYYTTSTATSFADCSHDIPVYIPCGKTSNYQEGWPILNNFIEIKYYIDVVSDDESHGSAEITELAACGDGKETVEAFPNEGYIFDRWSDGSTSNPYTINVPPRTTGRLVAHFRPLNDINPIARQNNMAVYVRNGHVVVDNCWGLSLYLYDMNGRIVASVNDAPHSVSIAVPTSGVYIVKSSSGHAKKCVVLK